MANKSTWRVVKTTGGYGVMKSSSGASKTTVVRPSSATSGRASMSASSAAKTSK